MVSRIYVAAGAPSEWADVFDDITHCLEGTACSFAVERDGGHEVLATTISPEAALAYESYYHELDFVARECARSPAGVVRGGWDLVANNRGTEFHQDWQRRFEMTDGLFVRLGAPTNASFVVSAPPHQHPFESPERVRFVGALVPHLSHALMTRKALRDNKVSHLDDDAALDLVRHGVVIVSAGARIERMNATAEQLLRSQDGLRARGSIIEAVQQSADQELQAAIANAVAARDLTARVGAYLVCGRNSAKRPLIMRVVPLDENHEPNRTRAAVVIIDPERVVTPPKVLLRKLFDLSHTEIDVALRMLHGDGLKAIADDLTISLATVKTHIQHVFRKTDCHRQAELVRLLLTVSQ